MDLYSGKTRVWGGSQTIWDLFQAKIKCKKLSLHELIALALASEQANWLRDLLYEIPLWKKPIPSILIHCDSTPTIGRVKNYYYNGKFKPIKRKHSTVRSCLSSGIITVDYVKFNDNLADPFTKALEKDRVWNTLRVLGLKFIDS